MTITPELAQELVRYDRTILREIRKAAPETWTRIAVRVEAIWLEEDEVALSIAITNADQPDERPADSTMMIRALYTGFAELFHERGLPMHGLEAVAWQDGDAWRYRYQLLNAPGA